MHLSTFLLAIPLALAALAVPIEEDKTDDQQSVKSKEPIDQALWDDMVFYGAFTTNVIQGDCAPPPYGAERVAYINGTASDTQAAIFRLDKKENIIISFPGTSSLRDVITDIFVIPVDWFAPGIDCHGCQVHLGFLFAWHTIQERVISTVNKELEANPNYKIIVTGHSLGGALGTLAFSSLRGLGHDVVAWVAGSPRVGDSDATQYIDSLSGAIENNIGSHYRVTAYNDLIPRVPWWPYVHAQTEIWLSGPTKPEQGPGNTFSCFGELTSEPSDCNLGTPNPSIATHLEYSGIEFDFTCDDNGNLVPRNVTEASE